MFRQGIRRCAGLAVPAVRSTATLLRGPAPFSAASLSRRGAPLNLKALTLASRKYSTESAAAEESGKASDDEPEESTKFAQLADQGVHENLLRAILVDMQYEDMTPVQAKTLRPTLEGNDIVAQAKTGTGKTIAFLLPLLQRVLLEDPSLAQRSASYRARSDDIRGIILSPTRELAEQIAVEARRLTRHTGIVVQSAVGGTQKSMMLRQVQRAGCHLMVATPGRLNDLLSDPRSGIRAPNLASLVLDEADRMLDVGFEKELEDILDSLPDPKTKVRQTMLVSATIPDNVIRLARTMIRPDRFTFVQTIPKHESLTHDRVPQHVVACSSWANIFPSVFEIIDREMEKVRNDPVNNPGFKAIVYFNTTAMVEFAAELAYNGRRSGTMPCPMFNIQSRLNQQQRTKAAELFRSARNGVLFSSDVTARGMDFPNVTHVIQVDVPRDRASYIHRLGRTARQGKKGEGWLILPPTSVSAARSQLSGMPLVKNDDLTAATINVDSDESSAYHKTVADLARGAEDIFGIAYSTLFGATIGDKRALVDDLNLWATKGIGYSEPPPMSESWARNSGLSRTNINIRTSGRESQGGEEDGFGSMMSDRRDDNDGFGGGDRGRRSFGRRDGGGGGGGGGYGRRGGGGGGAGGGGRRFNDRRDSRGGFRGGDRDSGRPSW